MIVKLKEIKRQWNKTGMRQIINSGHKTFDNQTNVLDNSGNMIARTQYSHYIRNYNETQCNGETFKQGELQNYDMKRLPYNVKQYINKHKDFRYWYSEFYVNGNLFASFLLNTDTNDLQIFDYSKNMKQYALTLWLKDYMFEEI